LTFGAAAVRIAVVVVVTERQLDPAPRRLILAVDALGGSAFIQLESAKRIRHGSTGRGFGSPPNRRIA
jgi:hypothetical protein